MFKVLASTILLPGMLAGDNLIALVFDKDLLNINILQSISHCQHVCYDPSFIHSLVSCFILKVCPCVHLAFLFHIPVIFHSFPSPFPFPPHSTCTLIPSLVCVCIFSFCSKKLTFCSLILPPLRCLHLGPHLVCYTITILAFVKHCAA